MAFTNKKLAQGQVTTKANILTPSGKTQLVHNISLFNTTSGAITFKIYRYDGATERQTHELSIGAKETIDFPYPAEGLVVESGHRLTFEATGATNYFIDGTDETSTTLTESSTVELGMALFA